MADSPRPSSPRHRSASPRSRSRKGMRTAPKTSIEDVGRLRAMMRVRKTRPPGLSDEMYCSLAEDEAVKRCDVVEAELQELEVAIWAWRALLDGRLFCFQSRMKRLELQLPSTRRRVKENEELRESVLNHRQRAMASVILHALADPSTHRRQQLEEIFRGAGSLRVERSERYVT
eukprot:Sspe_Gene.88610::Locus_60580_Transcript_3_5_Confidence_0.286_Length_3596::g.88610::m.88610